LFKYVIESFSKGKYFLFASITEVVALFLYNLYIARIFGPEVYGEIKTILAVTGIIITFFDFGCPIHLQRYAARTNTFGFELNKIFFIKLISSFYYFIITTLYFFLFSPTLSSHIVFIVIVSTLLLNFSNIFFYVYYGTNRISLTFKFTFISRIALLIILIVFLPFNIPVEDILILFLLSNLLLVLFSVYGLKEIKTKLLLLIPSFAEIVSLLKETFPLGLTTIFNLLYGKIDIVILSILLNYVFVAQYCIPYSLYKLSGMIFSSFLIPAFNSFSRHQDKRSKNIRIFYCYSLVILTSSSIIAAFIFLFGGLLLHLLYGNKYELAAAIIPYFSIAVIGLGMNSLTGTFLNATGNYNLTMFTALAGLIFNFTANILLITKIGIMGAVYAAIFTETVVFILQLFFIIKINYDVIWKRTLTY
jgi:O-antigen/teichoic acid export membrane protein